MSPRILVLLLVAGLAAAPLAEAQSVVRFDGLPEADQLQDICVTALPEPGVDTDGGCGTATMSIQVGPITITITVGPGVGVGVSYCDNTWGLAYAEACMDPDSWYNYFDVGAAGVRVRWWSDPEGAGYYWGELCYTLPRQQPPGERCSSLIR